MIAGTEWFGRRGLLLLGECAVDGHEGCGCHGDPDPDVGVEDRRDEVEVPCPLAVPGEPRQAALVGSAVGPDGGEVRERWPVEQVLVAGWGRRLWHRVDPLVGWRIRWPVLKRGL